MVSARRAAVVGVVCALLATRVALADGPPQADPAVPPPLPPLPPAQTAVVRATCDVLVHTPEWPLLALSGAFAASSATLLGVGLTLAPRDGFEAGVAAGTGIALMLGASAFFTAHVAAARSLPHCRALAGGQHGAEPPVALRELQATAADSTVPRVITIGVGLGLSALFIGLGAALSDAHPWQGGGALGVGIGMAMTAVAGAFAPIRSEALAIRAARELRAPGRAASIHRARVVAAPTLVGGAHALGVGVVGTF